MAHNSAALLVSGSPADLLPEFPPIPSWVPDVVSIIAIVLGLALALLALWLLFTGGRTLFRKMKASETAGEDLLTWVAAAIATGVSAQGMWRFAGDVLGFDGPLKVMLFAFIEVAMFTSAVRARRNMRENFSAGIDGMAVWVLTCLSAVLSCMDARSIPEAVFRLAAPLVAAWLWERGMAIERHRATGRKRINWRITPERVMVWLGLAEAKDRTADEVDAHRRLTRVALAAKKVHQLREAGASNRKVLAAVAKRDRFLDKAVEHTDLARDAAKQTTLLDLVTTLGGGDSLSDVLKSATAPWSHLDHPAMTGAAKNSEAAKLAGALGEWTAAIEREHDPEVSAAVTSMAAYISGQHVAPKSPVPDNIIYVSVPGPTAEPTSPSSEGRSWLDSLKPWRRPDPQPAARPLDDTREQPEAVTDLDADPVAEGDQDGDRDEDQTGDRGSPTEQDNRAAEEWIRVRCRGKNGTGRKPTQSAVAGEFKFSTGWARNRLVAVQDRMTVQGYVFQPDGVVISPRMAVADPVTTTASPNGSAATN